MKHDLHTQKGQSAIEYLMTYGWMLIVVVIVGVAIFTTVEGRNPNGIEGFNFTESKQAVERVMPGDCVSTENLSYTSTPEYRFECTQDLGNHTYVAESIVEYNETGNNRVLVYP